LKIDRERPRILLADDHQAVLKTVTQLLAVDFDVVGAVENGELAVQAVTNLDPDILILDISMPVMNGIEASSHLNKAGSRARVIFLTVQTQSDFVTAAFSVGAAGYVVKSCLTNDLIPAIREALEGRIFVSPSLGMDEMPAVRLAREGQDQQA